MKKRGDYLKKAYYHLMKIEQKKKQDPSGGELWRDQRGVKTASCEGRVFRFQRSLC